MTAAGVRRDLYVVGAGGQARESRALIERIDPAAERWRFCGYVEREIDARGRQIDEAAVVAYQDELLAFAADVVVGIGTPDARRRVALALSAAPDLRFPSLVHPEAMLERPFVSLGSGSTVAIGVVATINISVGDFTLLNFGVTVGHDVVVGSYCVVNPRASLSGGVVVGDGTLIGAGAVILEGRVIGEGAVVGAGAVVTRDVAPGTTVVGVPARPMDELQERWRNE